MFNRVTEDAVGIGIEGAAEHLAEPDEYQRDQDEEHRDNQFHRHDKLSHVGIAVFGAEKNLLRRGLMSDVHREPAPEVIDDEHGECGHHGCERDERKPRKPVPLRRAARQPHDMPRKHAIRATLVKNCRKMT